MTRFLMIKKAKEITYKSKVSCKSYYALTNDKIKSCNLRVDWSKLSA